MTRYIIAKLKKIQYWIASVAIVMVIVGVVYSHAQSADRIPGFGDNANIHDPFSYNK
jgi:hypothetical protein